MRARWFAVLFMAVVAGCVSGTHSETAAPPFELKDLNGKTVHLEDYRHHPVMLDFWATWCAPCRMSIPLIQNLYEQHKTEGLIILGIDLDEDPSGVYSFVKQFGMTYPVLLGGNSDVSSRYGIEGIPAFFLIDQEGKVYRQYRGLGADTYSAWESDVKALLKRPQ